MLAFSFQHLSVLAANPRPTGCEKLSGQEQYRLRQSRYGIADSISDKDRSVVGRENRPPPQSLPLTHSSSLIWFQQGRNFERQVVLVGPGGENALGQRGQVGAGS